MNRHTYNVKAIENNITPFTAKFTTNNTGAPDGLTNNLASVTRTAAGKFTVVLKDNYPACLFPDVRVVGAAAYDAYVTEITTSSNGNIGGMKVEVWSETAGVAGAKASGTLTCDTKANSTALDYYILNDGANKAMISYNKAGEAAKYSKLGAKAVSTLTCGTFAQITNEDYFTIWDGHRFWKIMFDTDGSGDSTGTADMIVVVTGLTTAAEIVTAVVNTVQETTSIVGSLAETIHLTAVDGAGDTVVFTCDVSGYAGNGTNTENMTNAAFTLSAAAGGLDAFPAEEFSHVNISGATTAAQVATLVHAAINALTEVLITSTDGGAGVLALQNDNSGTAGNVSQQFSETGTTLMALTDMAGGADGTRAAADTTDYDVYLLFWMRNSKLTSR